MGSRLRGRESPDFGEEVLIEGRDLYRYSRRGGTFDFRGLEAGSYELVFRYAIFPETRRTVVLDTESAVVTLEQRPGDLGWLEVLRILAYMCGGGAILLSFFCYFYFKKKLI